MDAPKKRLVFEESQQCERVQEHKILSNAFDRLDEPEIVFVAGASGTGKSSLVASFGRQIKDNCYFVSGKYDESVQQDPFAVLFRTIELLCNQILQQTPEEIDRLRSRFPESSLKEFHVLADSVPSLVTLLGPSMMQLESSSETTSATTLSTKMNFLFVRLLQCLSTKEKPVVLFLDDLQWINAPTLDLLVFLLTDAKIRHFMFLGSYRREQEHELKDLFDKLNDYNKATTNLLLDNLSQEDVTMFVTRVLDHNDAELLAQTLYQKTQGNPFYIKSYLELLVRKEILTFSYSQYAWTWDLDRVEGELKLSDNVVAVVLAKLRGLQYSLQHVMVLASYLPSTFDRSILQTLMEQCGDDSTNLEQRLDDLVMDGLLVNTIGSTQYSFAHDRIQQASTEFRENNGQNQEKMNQAVGKVLADVALSENAEDWMIFAAIERLEQCGYNDRETMISYYTIAGKRSASMAAYGPAALYYGKAISLLRSINKESQDRSPDTGIWATHQEQCLDLFLAGAEVEFTIGNYERGNDYSQELLSNSKSEPHTLEMYRLLAEALTRQKRSVEGMEHNKRILQAVDAYPRHAGNPIDMLVRLLRTKSKLKKMPTDEILNLPMAVDPKVLLAMRTIESLVTQCGNTGKIVLFLQCVMVMFKITFQHGLTPQSAIAFMGFSMINYKGFGDEEFGKRMKEIAMALFERVPGSSVLVPVLAGSDVDAWYMPLNSLRERYDSCFEYAMSAGDCFGGMLGFAMNVAIAFLCGLPLSNTAADSRILITMLRQYKIESLSAMFQPFDDLVSCLTGTIEDPIQWVIDFELPNKKRMDKSRIPEFVQGCLNRAMAAYVFGNLQEAEKYLKGFRHYADHGGAFYEVISDTFYGPLIYMARFRQTKRRKYRAQAEREYKKLAKMARERGLNIVHKFHIVEAERDATFAKGLSQDKIKSSYDKAIATSRKPGYMQDAALASELAGEYFVRAADNDWACHYLNQAVRLYAEWGAEGKVQQMIKRHGSMITVSGDDLAEMKTTRKPRYSLASRMDIGSSMKSGSASISHCPETLSSSASVAS